MITRILTIDLENTADTSLHEIVQLLLGGGIIGYPTETVYGLGVDATNESAVEKLYSIKGRVDNKPFLVLVESVESASALVQTISQEAQVLIDNFWPGALTLLFTAKKKALPDSLIGPGGTIGLRNSPDLICKAILERLRRPLVSTSANTPGDPPARSAQDVLMYFKDKIDIIVDGGERTVFGPSTVVDVSVSPPRLLREGALPKTQIERFVPIVTER